MKLYDIVDRDVLSVAIRDGFVARRQHEDAPLAILNYTQRCQYERGAWNDTTRLCRGLIYRTDTSEVVARPFPKFFNYGEPNAPSLDLGAPAEVTDKMDGCFPRQTALNLWGGGTIRIGDVVRKRLPVTLVGMNDRGELVPSTVTDWHDNGRKDHWLDIEVAAPVSRTSGAAGHPNRLRVTVNHHIMANGEYRPACEIRPGDVVLTQAWRPSDEVVRVVRASLLGDGCLVSSNTKPNRARYQESHSVKQAAYTVAIRKALGDCVAVRSDTTSGYGSTLVWVGTREYEELGVLRQQWYPGGVKRVPADLSWLDDFSVAKWLMDDGHRQRFKAQADRIGFATHSFPREDIVRLGDRLAEMYGVTYHLTNDGDRGIVLVVNSGRRQEIGKLWTAIAPHVHPSMRYKLPEGFHGIPYEEMSVGRELTVRREVKVVAVSPVDVNKRNFPSGRTGYDITTTTHNYMARGVLVHNSLGILYPHPTDGYAIATRGSFDGEQAEHATDVWQRRYAGYRPPVGWTLLYEIIYPSNRIVVDYGDMDDLVLLGAVNIPTGVSVSPWDELLEAWDGPRADVLDYATLRAALSASPRANAEGVVVRVVGTEHRVKIKQEDYLALHRIVTGLNERTVWQHLADGKPMDDILNGLPDEFQGWVMDVANRLTEQVDKQILEVEQTYLDVLWILGDGFTRKDFALKVAQHPLKWALFAKLDDKDYLPDLWKHARPEHAGWARGTEYSEDVA